MELDLKAEKQKIVEMIQANQVDLAKNKAHGEDLTRGSIYLKGQLDLVSKLIESSKDQESNKEEGQN